MIDSLKRGALRQAVLVCVDDFVGTGYSATAGLKQNVLPLLEECIPGWQERILLVYAAVVGYEEGLAHIRVELGDDVHVACYHTLTSADKAFSPENDIFASADERLRAHDIAKRIGEALERRHPLGYEDSQALIVFPDNTPNNTLPIFYKNDTPYQGRPWRALFPRS